MEYAATKDYYGFMIDAAVLFGANKTLAEREQYDALRFEMDLAKVCEPLNLCKNANFESISYLRSPQP